MSDPTQYELLVFHKFFRHETSDDRLAAMTLLTSKYAAVVPARVSIQLKDSCHALVLSTTIGD